MSSVEGDTQNGSDGRRFSAVIALIASGVVAIGLLAGTVLLLSFIGPDFPEASLSLVFVCAAVVLILVVCTLAIVLRRLGLTDRTEAMGLPSGTIRAVIALLLIMLFFIAAIFLFNSTQNETDPSETRSLQGVPEAVFTTIPIEQIQTSVPRQSENGTVYDVDLFLPPAATATSDDLAKQLITTVGTLVTAVAAFYFGANSVKSAISEGGVSASDKDTPDLFPLRAREGSEEGKKGAEVKKAEAERENAARDWKKAAGDWKKAEAEWRRAQAEWRKVGGAKET